MESAGLRYRSTSVRLTDLTLSCAAGPASRSRSGTPVAANDVRRTEWRTATGVTPPRLRGCRQLGCRAEAGPHQLQREVRPRRTCSVPSQAGIYLLHHSAQNVAMLALPAATAFGYLLYVYLPFSLFRLGTRECIDVAPRRTHSQWDDLVVAIFPAAVLNCYAFGLWRLAGLPSVDWRLLAAPLRAGDDALYRYVASGSFHEPLLYLLLLQVIAFGCGVVNGYVNLDTYRNPGPPTLLERHPVVAILGLFAWRPFAAVMVHEEVALFSAVARTDPVAVFMKNGKVYRGDLLRYDVRRDGDLQSITVLMSAASGSKEEAPWISALVPWDEIASVEFLGMAGRERKEFS